MIKINVKFIYERSWWQNLLLVSLGVLFLSFGSAINFCAGLGNDPVSVLFDGISFKFHLSLGTAAYLINAIVFLVAFIFGKKHLGIGTLIYVFFTGKLIDSFVSLYKNSIPWQSLPFRALSASVGCFIMLFGVVLMVVSSLGSDVWTAAAMALSDFFKKDYKKLKIISDSSICFLGFVCGGTAGLVTLVLVLSGGPFVKFMSKKLEKIFL